MSRKNKIIVSIVGITIVLLALLGLTYAYYLTRIQGNTNTTSISITTADLKLEYSEGQDSNINLTGLMPGVDIPAKTFTVTNSGNSKVDNYVVAIIDVTNTLTRTEDLTYTLTCVQKNAEGVVTGTCRGVDTDPDTEYPTQNSMIVTNSIDAEYSHEYTLKLTYENLTDTDQSIDMGSTIKGKVQIYGLSDTIDLTGTVTGASEGDYIQINSEQMTSQIVDGTYTLVGIEPGVHSLKIMNKEGVKQKEQYIKINKGEEVSVTTGEIELEDESTVNGPIITIVDTSRTSTIDINKTTGDYTPNNKVLDYNPFKEETLAYKIVDNAINSTNFGTEAEGYAVFKPTPRTTPAVSINDADEASLSQTADDYTESTGINSYYFRGNVKNNYVNFAGMCWRVVRIEGDGSVKLILEDMYEQCNDTVGKDLNNNGTYFTGNWSDGQIYLYNGYDDFFADFINYTEENGLQYSFKTFQNTLLSAIDETYNRTTLEDKLKIDEWCYDNVITETVETCYDEDEDGEDLWCYDKEYYGAYTRIEINKEPSLKCTGTKITNFNDEDNTDMYVGTLTADEVSFAGGYNEGNSDYYLMNDYDLMNEEDDDKWFTLSPLSYWEEGYAFSVNYLGSLDEDEVFYDGYSRPAVTLRSDSLISEGIGTQDRPYVIE